MTRATRRTNGALLAIPFVVVAIAAGAGARWGVPVWGDALGRELSRVVGIFHPGPRAPAPVARAPLADPLAPGAPPVVVHVPARAVQYAIDDEGVRIRARTALGADGRPAGVRLTGVTGLDAGLRDGDTLVAVEGQPTMDEGAAADVTLAAVARGAAVVHATAMRGDQPVLITADWPPVAVLPRAPVQPPPGKAR